MRIEHKAYEELKDKYDKLLEFVKEDVAEKRPDRMTELEEYLYEEAQRLLKEIGEE